jgi:branched-chain amino acid aminotransferase
MGMESRYIWMDGKLVEFANATVHFLNVGLHYGMAVFEGIRCYKTEQGPAVFRLPEHAERLIDSAHVFGLRHLPWTAEDVAKAITQTIAANEFEECYIRPVIWLGEGGWNINVDGGTPHLGIATWAWGAYLGEAAIEAGIRANISSYTRHHINVMMTKAKIAGNYANSALAKTESVRLGFDEAIMLDPQGYIAECTGENIFVVRGGRITTPPTTTILEGVTRDSLITIARDLGYEVSEQMISRDQLYVADEVFVCGTAAECIALREIDFRTIGSGKMGPITRRIQHAYQAAIHGRDPQYAQWLTPVSSEMLVVNWPQQTVEAA